MMEEDRISDLPDHLLEQIFSNVDMKQAVQASILGRRWRSFWVSLSILNFDYHLWETPTHRKQISDEDKFNSFVEHVLGCSSNSKIKRIKISSLVGNCYLTRCLYDWITVAVVKCNVEEIDISISYCHDEFFELPNCIFESGTRVSRLRLDCPGFRPPVSMYSAPNLRTLYLLDIVLLNPSSTYRNASYLECPSLESLTLINCDYRGLTTFTISAPLLENLEIRNSSNRKYSHYHHRSCALKISTPNLKSFKCRGQLFKDYSLENLSESADIDFDIDMRGEYAQCLLELPNCIFESGTRISRLRLDCPGFRAPVSMYSALNLKTLYLYRIELQPAYRYPWRGEVKVECPSLESLTIIDCDYGRIKTFTISAPLLENLKIRNSCKSSHGSCALKLSTPNLKSFKSRGPLFKDYRLDNLSESADIDFDIDMRGEYAHAHCLLKVFQGLPSINSLTLSAEPLHLQSQVEEWGEAFPLDCRFDRLKFVKIESLRGSESELKFIESILGNATVLEKIAICTKYIWRRDEEKKLVEFSERLQTLPRASSCAVILYTISRTFVFPIA